MPTTRTVATAILMAGALAPSMPTWADTLAITSVDDNTLIEDPNGAWSNGAGLNFYVGRVGTNGGGGLRRGVIKFDVSAIPAGSTIESVTLKLQCTKAGSSTPQTIALKRLLASFGEGASSAFGGGGAPSQAGDATWIHRSYPSVLWSTPGGEFVPTASATKSVGVPASYVWASTPALVADVQGWLDNPAANFGWLVQGNETTLNSVKRFDAHETTGSTKPLLTITYAPPPPPMPEDLNGDDLVDGADLGILLGQWGSTGNANIDGVGVVDGADLALLLGAWTG
ncbi:MAG: DNRLRE domain-containing protein [Phycisphaerae bacterium]|nr:DNRLRE domain-containing protein [Phycisphaerae bacterium]